MTDITNAYLSERESKYKDDRVYLKVKIKSLADEARIIRKEERKRPGPSYHRTQLRYHRITVVKMEARAAQIAYGFIRGRRLEQLESKFHCSWSRMRVLIRARRLVAKYGPRTPGILEEFDKWCAPIPYPFERTYEAAKKK